MIFCRKDTFFLVKVVEVILLCGADRLYCFYSDVLREKKKINRINLVVTVEVKYCVVERKTEIS